MNKSHGPANQVVQGYKNKLYPYVEGQSGTAMPASYVVTNPPTQIKGKVTQTNTKAKRCGQGLSQWMVEFKVDFAVMAKKCDGNA